MPDDNSLSEFLEVGNMALFQVGLQPGAAASHRTNILGWHPGSYIFLERPRTRDRFLPMTEGMACVIRFVREGAACGFVSSVMDWSNFDADSWCRVAWPEEIHSVGFRRHQRVETNISCTLVAGDGKPVNGDIRDISVGGCRIVTSLAIEREASVRVSFILPGCGPLQDIEAVVRRIDTNADGRFIGCEFAEGQNHVASEIAFFVTCKRSGADGLTSDRPRVLVMDQNHVNRGLLWRAFNERGYEVITANSAFEGIFRLQLIKPAGLIVSRQLPEMTGLDVCQLVRANGSFQSLPIVLYGEGDESGATPDVQGKNISWFSSAQMADGICDAILKPSESAKP